MSSGGIHDQPKALVAVLSELRDVRSNLDHLEYAVVQLVRSSGATWEDIGEILDISRQAARQRFSKPKPRRASS